MSKTYYITFIVEKVCLCKKMCLRYFLHVYCTLFTKFGRLVLYYSTLYDIENMKFVTEKID